MSTLLSPFLYALDAVRDALEEFGQPWVVTGGVAVIARGVARPTLDIDVTVQSAPESLPRLAEVLGKHWAVQRIDGALEFAREHQILLLQHSFSGVPIDVGLARLPFEEQAIARAERVDWAGVTIPVARPDDLLISKLVSARPGDLADAETLLSLHGQAMELPRVLATVREFAEVLGDSGRLEVLAHLLDRTGLRT
jgi:nucleotidyltransferase AbiEii toxin of type IV toxin-antitoxin system